MTWITRCNAIAGSASYLVNGYPELQVKTLENQLRAAAADGIDWRTIYVPLFETWHTRRPLFPDMATMARHIEEDPEASSSPPKSP